MIPRITPDTRVARAYLNRLERRELPRVIGRSLTRTGNSSRTFLSRSLRERVNLPKAAVDREIRVRRSNEIQTLTALNAHRAWFELRLSGKPIALRDFDARETRRGVTFKVAARGKRKRYERQGRRAFIVRSLAGHVFVRIEDEPPGPKRPRIKKVFGPALPHWLFTKRLRAEVTAHAQEFWPREVISNARFALRRRGAL